MPEHSTYRRRRSCLTIALFSDDACVRYVALVPKWHIPAEGRCVGMSVVGES
jgi:hypothetical protein